MMYPHKGMRVMNKADWVIGTVTHVGRKTGTMDIRWDDGKESMAVFPCHFLYVSG